jgi:hypothetical protein
MSNQAEFPHDQKNQFLSRVDLSKGPILVAVQNIIRTMAVDWDSPKRERKEYMYYTTQWEGKNDKIHPRKRRSAYTTNQRDCDKDERKRSRR